MIDGLVIVDKPSGMTSHDVVGRCRKLFGQKRVGHAGTLDPDATGVLLVGLGRATRLMQYMSGLSKSYDAHIVLGVATTTLDASGQVTGQWDMGKVSLADARVAAANLTGNLEQIPPMVSAVKVDGRRLHELARAGVEIERPARPVTVSRFDVEWAGPPGSLTSDAPVLTARIDCSSGTYIRVLAADLGAALGGGAHVSKLRRTAVGPWTLSDSTSLDDVTAANVLPPVAALPWIEKVTVDGDMAADVGHGKVLDASVIAAGQDGGRTGEGPWQIVGPSGDLLAIYVDHGHGRIKPTVVLASSGSD